MTETKGSVQIDDPRDGEGTFDPVILKKRQRRLNGVDEMVLSLYAKDLTTGEISAPNRKGCHWLKSGHSTSLVSPGSLRSVRKGTPTASRQDCRELKMVPLSPSLLSSTIAIKFISPF